MKETIHAKLLDAQARTRHWSRGGNIVWKNDALCEICSAPIKEFLTRFTICEKCVGENFYKRGKDVIMKAAEGSHTGWSQTKEARERIGKAVRQAWIVRKARKEVEKWASSSGQKSGDK